MKEHIRGIKNKVKSQCEGKEPKFIFVWCLGWRRRISHQNVDLDSVESNHEASEEASDKTKVSKLNMSEVETSTIEKGLPTGASGGEPAISQTPGASKESNSNQGLPIEQVVVNLQILKAP